MNQITWYIQEYGGKDIDDFYATVSCEECFLTREPRLPLREN